jgi:hypothetical protein
MQAIDYLGRTDPRDERLGRTLSGLSILVTRVVGLHEE